MNEAAWMGDRRGDSFLRNVTDEVSTASSGPLAPWQQQPLMGDVRCGPGSSLTTLLSCFPPSPGGRMDCFPPTSVYTEAAQPLPMQPEPSAVPILAAAPEGSNGNSPRLLQIGQTTVMIKHVPAAYSQRKLLREFASAGFQGLVDFFYLPMDARSRANRGFAFCNLVNSTTAVRFYNTFHGGKLQLSEDGSPALEVNAAQVQGFEENAKHFLRAKATKGRDSYSRPLFLRPLPPGMKQQMHSAGCKPRPANADAKANANAPPAANRHRAAYAAFVAQASDPAARQQPPPWTYSGAADQPQRRCQSCGRSRLPGFNFCSFCGHAPATTTSVPGVLSFWL